MLLLIICCEKSLKVEIAKIITAGSFFVSVFLKSGNKITTALQLLPPEAVIKHVHVLRAFYYNLDQFNINIICYLYFSRRFLERSRYHEKTNAYSDLAKPHYVTSTVMHKSITAVCQDNEALRT